MQSNRSGHAVQQIVAGLVGQGYERQQQVVQVDDGSTRAREIVAGDRGRLLLLLLLLVVVVHGRVEQGGQLQAVRVVPVGESVEPGRATAVLVRSLDIRPLEDAREQAMLEQSERVFRASDHPSPTGEENGDAERRRGARVASLEESTRRRLVLLLLLLLLVHVLFLVQLLLAAGGGRQPVATGEAVVLQPRECPRRPVHQGSSTGHVQTGPLLLLGRLPGLQPPVTDRRDGRLLDIAPARRVEERFGGQSVSELREVEERGIGGGRGGGADACLQGSVLHRLPVELSFARELGEFGRRREIGGRLLLPRWMRAVRSQGER